MDLQATEHVLRVPGKYIHENRGDEKTLLILLHGYADSAASFLRRALPNLDDRFEIFAPNGPFPMPQRKDGVWRDAYAWYFADLSGNRILVHPSVASEAIAKLIEKLGLATRPKILCGFSQGGYLLPHLAHELSQVQRLIAVSAGFHPEYFERYGLRLPVSAIHGDQDEVVPFPEAKGDFQRLGEWNQNGRFLEVKGMKHELNEDGRVALRDLLEKP